MKAGNRIVAKNPFLSDKSRKTRLEFAKKYKNWTIGGWKRVIWADESWKLRVWRKIRENLSSPTFQNETPSLITRRESAFNKEAMMSMKICKNAAVDFKEQIVWASFTTACKIKFLWKIMRLYTLQIMKKEHGF